MVILSSLPNTPTLILIITILATMLTSTNSQPSLNSLEQESLYQILDSLNPTIPWRTLFPDDLCSSAPHGAVCGYTSNPGPDPKTDLAQVNIIELNFGYESEHNPNPPCHPNSTLPDPSIFSSFPYLKKILFYNCFTHRPFSLNTFLRNGSSLEELVFIDNPSLYGSLTLVNYPYLRRLVITGSNVSGDIPFGFGELSNLEEVTLSRNKLKGALPGDISNLTKVKILDFSQNMLGGNIPINIGNLKNMLKMDFSFNKFSGEFPMSMKGLKSLEYLDLSYNKFIKVGVPLVLEDMVKLKEVYLSGNELGGVIPDIWGKLSGLNAIGFSGLGLVGNIPSSIGVFLENLTYIALDNNNLSGSVPLEFERLNKLNELDLRNNSLSGRLSFSAKFVTRVGRKLKVQGNIELCVDERSSWSFVKSNGSLGELKVCNRVENPISPLLHVSSGSSLTGHQVSYLVVMFIWFLFM